MYKKTLLSIALIGSTYASDDATTASGTIIAANLVQVAEQATADSTALIRANLISAAKLETTRLVDSEFFAENTAAQQAETARFLQGLTGKLHADDAIALIQFSQTERTRLMNQYLPTVPAGNAMLLGMLASSDDSEEMTREKRAQTTALKLSLLLRK